MGVAKPGYIVSMFMISNEHALWPMDHSCECGFLVQQLER